MKPETLLAAARLAYPQYEWHLVNGNILREGGGEFGLAGISYQEDAYALWKALAMQMIVVAYDKNAGTWYVVGVNIINTGFKTDTDAMLAALEAMK